MVLRLN
ncbi:unnamed protein product [Acanthoscelides obtectus]|nr:unnamed protein product [Acanthoscelides obtectus]CAK1649503.1 hypothetical protein AOBTE_LOCUS16278 [Acanthoscelides obtectus]